MDTIKALIFDCDGTLVDSMPWHFKAWRDTMNRYGILFSEERFYKLGGTPIKKIIELLALEAGRQLDIDQIAREKEEYYFTLIPRLKPRRHVLKIINDHLGLLPMALASGSSRASVRETLTYLNALHWFDTLVCAEDVAHHKPAPDIFLEAAKRLGVAPEACRVYEDSPLGIEAAKRAGMEAVDVRGLK
jgi:HAD superfamily hydrolase (TIGR01509 family)